MLGPQGSDHAAERGRPLHVHHVCLTIFFFFFNGALIWYAVRKWRRRSDKEVTPHITHDTRLELIWSIIPLIVVMGIFFWGFAGYVQGLGRAQRRHRDRRHRQEVGLAVRVSRRHPHAERPPRAGEQAGQARHALRGCHPQLLSSPASASSATSSRAATPNSGSPPPSPASQQVFCAEYCGKGHSDMLARIFVDTPEQYETFLREGDEQVRKMPLEGSRQARLREQGLRHLPLARRHHAARGRP